MNYATKIKMKSGCTSSVSLTEISKIYVKGDKFEGYYRKEYIHDYLKDFPGTIVVAIYPYSKLIPVVSVYGEKYVKSKKDDTTKDNLLALPQY